MALSMSIRFGKVRTAVFLLIAVQWLMFTEAKLSICNKKSKGVRESYRKVSGDEVHKICVKNNGQYEWIFRDGSPTLGQRFNPAKDCLDIVENVHAAKDGFYWIKLGQSMLLKAWCDTHTDGGGFMLIGMNNNSVTWGVPSDNTSVDPMGPPHWSSEFGDVNIQDFAIQISTTSSFKDTKAHWFYRLKPKRNLGNLLGVASGGCTDVHSGIGNVSFVKDILTETVVTTKFNCSKFAPHYSNANLGWGRMNYCLRNKCPMGYARMDSFGSFSYSVSSELSGITDDATAFLGCDNDECCACFGPKGGRDHYCSKKCQAINGGTVLKSQVYVWFWMRTRMPKRLWKRCMEFKMKTEAGKFETYYIDRNTGTPRKGSCSRQFQTFLNDGTLLVKNKESFNNLPPVPGLLSYREDNEKLYVNNGNNWDEIVSEKETENLTAQVKQLQENVQTRVYQQKAQIKNLERNMNAKLQSLTSKTTQQDTQIQNLERNINAKLENLTSKSSQQDTQIQNLERNINAKLQSLTKKNSQQDARIQNLETNINAKLQNLENTLKVRLNKIENRLYAMRSCKNILAANISPVSGTHWIKLASSKPFQVYCDMETRGGGWTLVYSYTFTNYNSFSSGSNAVTPRPNWPATRADVPISTTPPLSESSLGAVDWNLWKNIGKEFMVKSNINDWIVCQPNGGSLVTKTQGSMSCQNIKNVATACSGVAPNRIYWFPRGPFLHATSYYYFFDGSTGDSWPTHDPCGKNSENHKKGVRNPGGQIYLR